MASGGSGLVVIDVSDPSNPGTPVYEDTTGDARDIFVSGDYAYVADRTSGLAIIDISDPTDPKIPIRIDTTIWVLETYLSGDFIYMANGNSGLAVLQVRERVDIGDPVLAIPLNGIIEEYGYSGLSLSWTVTDANPNTYTIELQGSGIVTGPTTWTSGEVITYNIPDGFSVGSYTYTVNFTDDYGNYVTDSVTLTVLDDTTNPSISMTSDDKTVEFGYTGESLPWTAWDSNPNTYTIELQGSGIVAGPTAWTSNVAINYNIPDGFSVGSYTYIINFTDDFGNSNIDSVILTVDDTTNPTIMSAPSDLTVELGYTEQSFSWKAID